MYIHGKLKRKIFGIIKVICFLVILTICIIIAWNITKRKYAYQKNKDFFSQDEDFDVLFFGSSHVLNDIFPMDLWNDYGIISYNMGNHSETVAMSYYNMLLALKETNSELIVIDAYMVNELGTYRETGKANFHNTLDAYPISYTKYLAVKDIFKEDLLNKEIEYLFNFSIYHSRWSELLTEYFANMYINPYEKGAESRINVFENSVTKVDFNSAKIYDGEETINMRYLRKMIEYCQNEGMEILVIDLPFLASNQDIEYSKYVQTICDEYNINYINFLEVNCIESYIDYCDYDEDNSNSHLNPSGARKITDYLGNYIMENYDIEDQRENEAYDFWNEDYDEYIDFKISNLQSNKSDLNNYLMLLYGEEDISYDITISSKLKIKENLILQVLLKNLNNNYEIDDTVFRKKLLEDKDELEKTIKITTYDNRTGEEIETVWF